jgi:methanogenic corrinoid protein MtbC1
MQPEQRNREVLDLPAGEAKTENLINELIGCMIDLETDQFEQLLDKHIAQYGIYTSITTIIFHFLEKTGILWQTGRINPAHEHIVSNIVRQKIVTAIEGLPPVTQTSPKFLLLLPEYEYHELGLLFVYYMLKQKGLSVIYLGANVPLKDALYVAEAKSIKYIYIHLTSIPSRLNFQKYLTGLSTKPGSANVIISGSVTEQVKKWTLSETIIPLKSLPQVLSYISSL